VLRALDAEDRPARADEQAVLARWSGWGSLPGVFDDGDARWADVRSQLRDRLDDGAWDAARRTTLNAHYSPAAAVDAIWGAVRDLGFSRGRVLEPGCGSGNFIGMAPEGLAVEMVGVELDPTTAAIAQALYPRADVRSEGFERSRFADDSFDLAVGNVPFARLSLHDPLHNRGGHSLHNHFIIKSLDLTHPGGLVAVVTSRFTLDARNPAARREMAERADLVGAVRLPAGALRAAAGTDAVADLLILRRREPGRAPGGESWERVTSVATPDGEATINEYLARHPERVLGELRATGGQYGQADLTVVAGPAPLDAALPQALRGVVADARVVGLTWSAYEGRRPDRVQSSTLQTRQLVEAHSEGSIVLAAGGFARIAGGDVERYEVTPRRDTAELRALLGVRDAFNDLLALEATNADDEACAPARALLNRHYDAYADRYGALNRFSLVRTGRRDPDTGEDRMRRARPSIGGFRRDPDYRSVLALEVFDPETQRATKAPIFQTRVVAPREPRHGADTAQDALAICLDEQGHPELATVARLLGVDEAAARAELGDLVWDDPATGDLVAAQMYLSGDVRAKLAEAEAAALDDQRWLPNVEALRGVMPVDLGPAEIDARLGSAWIRADDVAAFGREVLECPSLRVEHAAVTATWAVRAPAFERDSVAASSVWGTKRADAVALMQSSLNQTPVTVYDPLPDNKRVINPAETLAAREKQEALGQRFSAWVWEDPDRSARLAGEYNRLFNSTVLPRYDGSHLSLRGVAANFSPHAHQRDAVWRIICEPTTLLAHDVGAGKTATMVMASQEMRRLGLVKKPCFVVPNHMLDQFSRELNQLYPQAKVLVATKEDTTAGARREFVARCATGDWDAVVMTQSAFVRIPVSEETRKAYVEAHVAELRKAIAESEQGERLTVKRLEARVAQLEATQAKLLDEDRKDVGVEWGATGVDWVGIDEAHHYKNRSFTTHMSNVGGQGSLKATDLELKLSELRQRHGERVTIFATATPIANSLSEMWVMQSYLQPERLRAAGVETFDAWAATFGRTVTALELAPDGGSYRLNTRFARFANVPELLTMFQGVADVRSAAQLGLAIPTVAGGAPETVVVPASEALQTYVSQLVKRAEDVRQRVVSPDEDNMLKIAGDGRRAALDLRLVGHDPDPAGGKAAAAAERIADWYHATKGAVYPDVSGGPSQRLGSLQLVFCDLGTPKPGEWSVYEDLRQRLDVRGVPDHMVRFIHEAGDDRAKAELFAACRDGRVAVLVGSTEKMGVGTNVQARLVALHHMDCPWRPADLSQRDGRALRQGNLNAEVGMLRYVTEGSFDVFMWQTCERKAAFIHQIMAGEVTGREVDDVGDVALSYAEVKALATGDPLILEKAGIDNDIARLSRLRQAHDRDQTALFRTVAGCEVREARLENLIALTDAAVGRRRDTGGDAFTMVVDGARHTKRVDAGAHLRTKLSETAARAGRVGSLAPSTAGQLAGFAVEIGTTRDRSDPQVTLSLADTPIALRFTRDEVAKLDPAGLVARLEHGVRGLDDVASTARRDLDHTRSEAAAAQARIGKPFPHDKELAGLRRRQGEIEEALTPVEPESVPVDGVDGSAEPSPAPAARLAAKSFPAAGPSGAGASPAVPAAAPGREHAPTSAPHR